jgi:hypothetical protein
MAYNVWSHYGVVILPVSLQDNTVCLNMGKIQGYSSAEATWVTSLGQV